MRPFLERLLRSVKDPGGERPRRDPAAFVAVVRAALTLAAIEVVGALAVGWWHGAGYAALVIGLSLGASALLGLASVWLALDPRLALAFWTVFATGTIHGGVAGVLVALAIAGGLRTLHRLPVRALSALAAGGLAVGSLGGTWLAGSLGLQGELGPGLALAAAFAGAVAAGCLLHVRLRRRFPEQRAALLLAGAFVLLAVEPALHRPWGRRRLPRAEDLVATRPDAAGKPNVFLFVLDTVRADHLSPYGHYRDTTPNLARWIARRPNSLVYPSAYANGTWTVPSHGSLFTGLAPGEHGAHFPLDPGTGSRFRFALRPDAPTLAGAMRQSGYATLGVFANNWLRIVGGMGAGFDRWFRSHHAEPWPFLGESLRSALVPGLYSDAAKGGAEAESVAADVLSVVEPWSEGARPLFCFANFGDAHGPYAPPPGFRGRFRPAGWRERPGHLSIHDKPAVLEQKEARYDEEIAYLDQELGELLDELDERGLLENSWVFVTSDHGEAFGEHGVTEHGTGVFEEIVRIPLVVFPPDGVELDVAFEPVGLTDVATTIASIGGTPLPGSGVDLRVPYVQRATRIEFYGDPWKALQHGESAALPARVVVRGKFKLVDRKGELALYDLITDPYEEKNLVADLPDVVRLLHKELPELAEGGGMVDVDTSAADLERLRAMGYAGAEGEGPDGP